MTKTTLLERLRRRLRRSHHLQPSPDLTIHQRRALAVPGSGHALGHGVVGQMLTDAMVQTALTVKRLAVVAAPWRIEPGSGSPEAAIRAEFVRKAFDRMDGSPVGILVHALDCFAHGWSIQELVYRYEDGVIWLHRVKPKDSRWFGQEFDAFGELTGLVLRLPGEAEVRLPANRFVVMRNRRPRETG